MMGRANMGQQVATAPASRLPVVTELDKARATAAAQAASPATQMKKGGKVKGYAKGGSVTRGDGCCMKGRTRGEAR